MPPRKFTTRQLGALFGIRPTQVVKAMEGIKPIGKRGGSFLWSIEQAQQLARAIGKKWPNV